jgi:hypothetical protein
MMKTDALETSWGMFFFASRRRSWPFVSFDENCEQLGVEDGVGVSDDWFISSRMAKGHDIAASAGSFP